MTGVKNRKKSFIKMFQARVDPPGKNLCFHQVLKIAKKNRGKNTPKDGGFKMPYHVLKLSSVQRGKKKLVQKESQCVGAKKRRPVPKVPKSGGSVVSSRQGAVEERVVAVSGIRPRFSKHIPSSSVRTSCGGLSGPAPTSV